jgi:hypothetical protein
MTPITLDEPPITIQSPKRVYTLRPLLKTGDIADIYPACSTGPDPQDPTLRNYLLKIGRADGSEQMLENEKNVLSAILTEAGDTTYRKYFPTLVESFHVHQPSQKRINVFTYERAGFYTAEEIRDRLPGVGGRHLAWMFKRLLTTIGFAHRVGYIHGAVLPPHVRFETDNHGLQLTSWGHAALCGKPIRSISARYRDWYPHEVLNREPAAPGTDIYLATRTILYLAGADPNKPIALDDKQVPIPMQRFFQSCLLPGLKMRPSDAWELHDEFDELLHTLYGQPKFHVLHIPE